METGWPAQFAAKVLPLLLSVEEVTSLLVADITEGIDALDYGSPIVKRTPHRAGVIKVGGSLDGPSDRDARCFEAAAAAHRATG